ncbi:MAG: inorganic phosphate transporter [Clostridiales Family XIII bacterium]|jgi:PiT family inorganic phosphate transporter|nr:inorganic phosphate transporter [Clostridiales Family XIII bacterium]
MSGIIIGVVIVALIFEFINGFHDTANAIATSVYTRALTAGKAIVLAAGMNFCGALVSEHVAKTISSGLVGVEIEEYVVLAALLGAIIWNLITWWQGIPSSSSHALIGSLIGATIVRTASLDGVIWSGVAQKVLIPLVASPFIGFFVGFGLMKLIYRLCQNQTPGKVNGLFAKLQVASAALVAFSHGTNDAQKTMGIITLALVSGSVLPADAGVPLWVKVVCAVAIATGTSVGGWKIMKTMGGGVTKLQPPGGFAAQASATAVIEGMSMVGAPISTTHVITSAVMGVGSAKRLSAVKWGKAKDIVLTWCITLPIAAALGGACTFLIQLLFV